MCDLICDKLPQYVSSGDLEVQERASSALHLMKYIQKQVQKEDTSLAPEIASLFAGELNPVAPKAQKKVQVSYKCLVFLPFSQIFRVKTNFEKK